MESIQRVYSLVKDVDDLDPAVLIELKHIIIERFPDFVFFGDDSDTSTTVSGGLLVTQASYEAKQLELQHILDIEIPLNSQEIGKARMLGDLKENAEYKAGKEKQELLNIAVGKLKTDLERAVIVRSADINDSKIVYGTEVLLRNIKTDTEEKYRILGPWESEPAKNIISYLAPFGSKLLNHRTGETIKFIINEREYEYEVKEITALDL